MFVCMCYYTLAHLKNAHDHVHAQVVAGAYWPRLWQCVWYCDILLFRESFFVFIFEKDLDSYISLLGVCFLWSVLKKRSRLIQPFCYLFVFMKFQLNVNLKRGEIKFIVGFATTRGIWRGQIDVIWNKDHTITNTLYLTR